MFDEFSDKCVQQREWGFWVAVAASFEGVGTALYLFSYFFGGDQLLAIIGLVSVAIGAAVLMLDLGHPLRSWRVLLSGSDAWIGRGVLFIGGFILFGTLSLLVPERTFMGLVFQLLALICSLGVMLYIGFMLSSMKAIPFWNNSWLVILFLFHSLCSGAVILLAASTAAGESAGASHKQYVTAIALIILSYVLTQRYKLNIQQSPAERESVHLITKGDLKSLYGVVSVFLGLLAPLVIIMASYSIFESFKVAATALIFLAMLLRLGGDLGFRYAIIKAGVYGPLT